MATQRARKAKTSPASSASSMLSLGRPAASLDPPSRRSTSRETVTTGRREVGGTAAFVDMTDDIRSEQQRDLMLHAQEHAAKVDPTMRSHSPSVISAAAMIGCSTPALL